MTRLGMLLLSLFLNDLASADQGKIDGNATDISSRGTEAVPIEKLPPDEYPLRALDKGVEGWIVTGFVVNPDGSTAEITVLDASVEGYFEEAAIAASEKFKYIPATWNGKPVAQARNTNLFTFEIMGGTRTVSRAFSSRFKKANKALEQGDYEATLKFIEDLDGMKTWKLTDVFLLDLLKADYWRSRKDYPQASKYYERSLRVADQVGTKNAHLDILRQAISLSTYQHRYGEALRYYDDLAELDPDLPPDDPAIKIIQRVRQLLDGDEPFEVIGQISQPCETCETLVPYWSYILMRDKFLIDHVEGKLDELKFLCGYEFVTVEFKSSTQWSVNKDWGACELVVLGTEGTTFRLVEL